MPNFQAGGAFLPAADYQITGTWDFRGSMILSGQTSLAGPVAAPQINATNTLTGAAYAASTNLNQILSKITLTPASSVSAVNGLNAIRGEINLTSGKSIGGTSFVTGVYGRGNIFGTVAIGSGDLAAVYGKFDLNGSTLTSGHIAPVQANIVNPPASAATTGAVALFYGESASGTKINAGLELYMASNFAFVMTDVNTSNYLPAISSTTLNGLNIKVQLNGTTYYIKTGAAAIGDRAWFTEKLAEVGRRKEKARADFNALEGVEQFCTQAIAELDAEFGLPLETLFPGATVAEKETVPHE